MTIHREGRSLLIGLFLVLLLLNVAGYRLAPYFFPVLFFASMAFYLLVLQFFRSPRRPLPAPDDRLLYAPADGKVVVIEETEETEYFNEKRLQVSIFMSLFDVHANRAPVSGQVRYYRYHPGRYLAAWNPKASTDNERNTIVIAADHGPELLMRQIAGAVARRIRCYLSEKERVQQGAEIGFIKFGSRVDLFLPPETELAVDLGEQVYAGKTVLARWGV